MSNHRLKSSWYFQLTRLTRIVDLGVQKILLPVPTPLIDAMHERGPKPELEKADAILSHALLILAVAVMHVLRHVSPLRSSPLFYLA